MMADEFIGSLQGVRARGPHRWSAKCPAHADKSPSLTVSEGERGLLVKCWAGCSLTEITSALSIRVKDLFFDTPPSKEALRLRAHPRANHQVADEKHGRKIDALRQAEYLIVSSRGIAINHWSDENLAMQLNRLGNAYALLQAESEGTNE